MNTSMIEVCVTMQSRLESFPRRRRIFVSYQHKDTRLVRETVDKLRTRHEVFFAGNSIAAGQDWAGRIEEALAGTEFLVVFLTSPSVSDGVLGEIERAVHRIPRPTIIPVRIGFSGLLSYPVAVLIGRFQAIDWDGRDAEWLNSRLEDTISGKPPRPKPLPTRRRRFVVFSLLAVVASGITISSVLRRSALIESQVRAPPKTVAPESPAPKQLARPMPTYQVRVALRGGVIPQTVTVDGRPAKVDSNSGLADLRLPSGTHRISAVYTTVVCAATFSVPANETISSECRPK